MRGRTCTSKELCDRINCGKEQSQYHRYSSTSPEYQVYSSLDLIQQVFDLGYIVFHAVQSTRQQRMFLFISHN